MIHTLFRSAVGLAVVSGVTWLAYDVAERVPFVSPLLISLFCGILLGTFAALRTAVEPGARVSAKSLLRLAVALLGLRLSLSDFTALGWETLAVIMATIVGTMFVGWALAARLNLSREFGALISVGTAICGASAVATVAPIVKANESEVSFSVTLVTVFGLLGVVLYPPLGQALAMSDARFGIWAGTAIHDTAQVMAAAFSFSPAAGEIAAAAKMLRITGLLPVTLVVMGMFASRGANGSSHGVLHTVRRAIPNFLVAFVLLVVARTLGWVPDTLARLGLQASEVLLVAAMAGVGMTTRVGAFRALGWRSVMVGLICACVAGGIGYAGLSLLNVG